MVRGGKYLPDETKRLQQGLIKFKTAPVFQKCLCTLALMRVFVDDQSQYAGLPLAGENWEREANASAVCVIDIFLSLSLCDNISELPLQHSSHVTCFSPPLRWWRSGSCLLRLYGPLLDNQESY